MNPLLYTVVIPIVLGLVCLLIPKHVKILREFLALLGSATVLGLSIWIFGQKPLDFLLGENLLFRLDNLSGFALLGVGFFGFLIALYSIKFMQGKEQLGLYYGSFLWTLGAACGALLANHLVVLLIFWGFLGITLYLMTLTGGKKAAPAAKKSLVIIGGSDALMLLGILFIFSLTSTFDMSKIQLPFDNVLTYIAFVVLMLGTFAKAGAMPLHTWIPDVAANAPITVSAFIPAALDKLLGIYLLARICLNLFVMTSVMNMVLIILGAFTLIAAVMMALVQHDLRKLLAYHAVSQVGYMILGIGTGNPIGIAGALFHMLNNTIYKTGLFLAGGSVQHRTGTTNLDKLGGLARFMPLTFISFMICALAISGIPPFNGFSSKWMIYQGLIEMGRSGDKLWILWLIAAMFGSALTLASFMKLTHSIFLGISSEEVEKKKIKEVGFSMSLPTMILALLCLVFGIFAFAVPLKLFILPAVANVDYIGIWTPGLSTTLIILGMIVGFIIYLFGNLKGIREADHFIGGEVLPTESRVTGTSFYNTIKNIDVIHRFYNWAEAKFFDLHDQLIHLSESIASLFKKAHSGILTTYMVWVVMGLFIILIVMMGR